MASLKRVKRAQRMEAQALKIASTEYKKAQPKSPQNRLGSPDSVRIVMMRTRMRTQHHRRALTRVREVIRNVRVSKRTMK